MSEEHPLLSLQALDTRLDQLDYGRSHLPETRVVEQVRARLDELARRQTAAEEARAEVARDEKRLEDELAGLGDRIEREKARLFDGSVTAARELQALQDEVESLSRRRDELENDLLEQMERAEPLQADLDELATQLAGVRAELAEAEAAAAAAGEKLDAEAEQLRPQRDQAAGAVDADQLSAYLTRRQARGGVVAGRLEGRRCTACHIELPPVEVDAIKEHPEGALVPCPSCEALLVR